LISHRIGIGESGVVFNLRKSVKSVDEPVRSSKNRYADDWIGTEANHVLQRLIRTLRLCVMISCLSESKLAIAVPRPPEKPEKRAGALRRCAALKTPVDSLRWMDRDAMRILPEYPPSNGPPCWSQNHREHCPCGTGAQDQGRQRTT
jgi:hypothetical protein